MASINDLNTRLTASNGTVIIRNTAAAAIASGTYFAMQVLVTGTYNFTIDGVAYAGVKIEGGIVLYGDITNTETTNTAQTAVALYKN